MNYKDRKCILVIVVSLVLSIGQVAAQQNFASISFGTTLPRGAYGQTGSLADGGYARPGGAIKFDAGYFPVSYLGIGGSFSFGSNYAMRDSVLQDMIRYIEDNASSLLSIPGNAQVLFGTGFWNYISLMLGPHFSFRASRRIYLDFRGVAGASVIRLPDQDLSITFDATEIYSRTSKSLISLGYSAGIGARFMISEGLAIKLGTDLYRSKARFEYAFELFRGFAEDVPPVQAEFPITTVEITAGLAYSF